MSLEESGRGELGKGLRRGGRVGEWVGKRVEGDGRVLKYANAHGMKVR